MRAPGTLAADMGKGLQNSKTGDQVNSFLKEHFLHWLEALGWLGKVSEGIHAISLLDSSCQPGTSVHTVHCELHLT